MTDPLKPCRVLITGSAVRIGREIAIAYAKQGAAVVVHYNTSHKEAENLLKELNTYSDGNEIVAADLLQFDKIDGFISGLCADRPLTTVINNASTYHPNELINAGVDTFKKDYDINFLVPHLIGQSFAKYAQKGHIINMLDRRVAQVDPKAGLYALAKKSLRDLTLACALDWAPNIRVNAIAPGAILPPPDDPNKDIGFLAKESPLNKIPDVQDIADACLFLERTLSITGQILYLDSGAHLT